MADWYSLFDGAIGQVQRIKDPARLLGSLLLPAILAT
jgi:hypothetical protein